MLRLMSIVAVALLLELVFFGPFGPKIYDIPVRRALMGGLIVMSLVPTLTQKPAIRWQINLLLAVLLFLIVWGGVVPMLNGVSIRNTLAEVQPVVGFLLVLPFSHLFRADGTEFYMKVIRRSVFVMASIVILVGAASNLLGRPDVAIALRNFYISLTDSDAGVYIGPLGDGTFRVMLINFIIFPLMLCYYNWDRPRLGWSAFYMLAILATGTRAFLVVGAMVIGVAMLRKRPILAAPALLVVAAILSVYMADLQRLRLFEFSSELSLTSARYLQYFSLMALFWEHPLFGAGLGANAILIRSYEAPYSYELTYVAFLAKLGVIGIGIVLTSLALWMRRLILQSPNAPSIVTLGLAMVMMTATNPYLVNLVGMTIVAVLIALGTERQGSAEPTAASPFAAPTALPA